ncbi:MAG: glycosyl transferase family 2 [Pedosphaera sp.]|nr:glycosyl transferase family 2 [Pedosphaera sp.]
MVASVSYLGRVTVDGKFFRLGEKKFYPKGVSYGPFAPNAERGTFASLEQTRADFAQIRDLGANLVRVYHVPPRWFLDLADEHGLKVLVDIPWNKHLCFLDSEKLKNEARQAVREAVQGCARHPAVFAYSLANEIAPDIVRWSGAKAVSNFIDELVTEAKRIDPDCLCTFTNYPPTEFLRPQGLDFLCFNVYLHNRQPFKNYLARLQMIADTKPLVLGEFGIDSLREGERQKCEILAWQIEMAFRGGLAGTVVFSYTDDWWRGGRQVEDWTMGLTTRDRQQKDSYRAVQKMFRLAPYFPLASTPRVSVVVASYQGERTLKACLDSLMRLNYPNYEVILVDDGSTDGTPVIGMLHKDVRYFRHGTNLGLSVARNTGIAAASGEIVAFTDSDCRADEDWLYYLVGDLLDSEFAGIGGHNFLPPDDSCVAAAVLVSPGGPAHVMLTDRQAEHIPGCNMAFYKWALEEAGGFDPIFEKAGDDVDICWRLQQRGCKIGFSPAGFVWHYRRSTVPAYLKQQHGYGEAEALLVRKHPEYFNTFGGSMWRGRIYTASKSGIVLRPPIIYHGIFGSGWFQTLYVSQPAGLLTFFSSLEYHVLVTIPLVVLSSTFHLMFPLAVTSLGISLGVCIAAGLQAELARTKRRPWSRPVVALLFFLQPIVRGWARYQGRLGLRSMPPTAKETLDSMTLRLSDFSLGEVRYWGDESVGRIEFVTSVLARLDKQGWPNKSDSGWSEYDLEVLGSRWAHLQLTTAAEDYPKGKKMIRCRLRTAWSLQAKVVFWAVFGFELLVIGFAGRWMPWLWSFLLTMPLLAWLLTREKRKLQSMMVVFLDEVAKSWKMLKVPVPEENAAVESTKPQAVKAD